MREPRFLVDADLAGHHSGARRVILDPGAARHAAGVLRLKAGTSIRLFDGRGAEYRAKLVSARRGEVQVELTEPVPALPEPPLAIILALGVSRGERMEFAVQKSVELGVARIVPLWTARGVVRLAPGKAEARLLRWRRIAQSACEQCGRSSVPVLEAPRTLDDWLAERPRAGSAIRLAGVGGRALACLPDPEPPVTILVGPEGGLDPTESQRVDANGFVAARLGPRTMRTETAAITGVAAVQLLWGDLGAVAAPTE
ncbi:MAG: 16S rRNA (uracil(1498)-N(3))-methyltransferase [Immundisolibacterales bacterium]|nr:16S rRNA (uracil(1498)-N(3))-methyltransferase [Immundisolibacterales bacterium]